MNNYAFTQNNFKISETTNNREGILRKVLIENKDTSIIIPYNDLKDINLIFIDRLRVRELNKALVERNTIQDSIILKQKEILFNNNRYITTLNNISLNKDTITQFLNKDLRKCKRSTKIYKTLTITFLLTSIFLLR